MADAVHLNDGESDGTNSDLLLPPDGCNILKQKSFLHFIGPLKTERISSMISVSFIDDDIRILPIKPFLARVSLIRGICTLLPSAKPEGRHKMSLS